MRSIVSHDTILTTRNDSSYEDIGEHCQQKKFVA